MRNLKTFCFVEVLTILWLFQTNICEGKVVKGGRCLTPNKRPGKCIYAKDCAPLVDILATIRRPYPAHVVRGLNSYACGYFDNLIHVCCPSTRINIAGRSKPKTSTMSPSKLEPPDVSNHENVKLLPEECGYLDSGDKIKKGNDASLNEFPWMALLFNGTGENSEFLCGGTIINDRYILTAAHCLTNLTEPLTRVRVGEYDILNRIDHQIQIDGTEKYNVPVQDLHVEEIIPYPGYNSQSLINDIGLIRVEKMNLSIESARPVCLPLGMTRNQKINYAVVTGWGYTSSVKSGGKISSILQKVDLPIQTLEKCAKAYESQPKIVITNTQLCAGGRDGKDACSGDSGGPLHVAAYVNGETRYVQQGVVSYGPEYCGFDGIPGVYTRVAYFMDWVLDNMKP